MPANPKPKKGTRKREQRARTKARRERQFGRDARGDFAAFVRAKGCEVAREWPDDHVCSGPVEFAHLASRGAHPERPGVGNGIGLCRRMHQRQHAWGWEMFAEHYGIYQASRARVLADQWEAEAEKDGPHA